MQRKRECTSQKTYMRNTRSIPKYNWRFILLTSVDKEKQWEDVVQDEKIFLYKLYDMTLEWEWSKTPKLIFIQEKINNLENVLKNLQLPIKMMPFYLLLHYKSLQKDRKQDKQYWKEIAVEFIK